MSRFYVDCVTASLSRRIVLQRPHCATRVPVAISTGGYIDCRKRASRAVGNESAPLRSLDRRWLTDAAATTGTPINQKQLGNNWDTHKSARRTWRQRRASAAAINWSAPAETARRQQPGHPQSGSAHWDNRHGTTGTPIIRSCCTFRPECLDDEAIWRHHELSTDPKWHDCESYKRS